MVSIVKAFMAVDDREVELGAVKAAAEPARAVIEASFIMINSSIV